MSQQACAHVHTPHRKFLLGPNREEDYTLQQTPNLGQISWWRAHSHRVASVCLASAASLDTPKHTRTYSRKTSQVNVNKMAKRLQAIFAWSGWSCFFERTSTMGLPGKRKESQTAKKVHACGGGRQGEDEMEAEDLLWRPVTRERRSCRLLLVL